eukprot:6173636-Pleurochrysis_carterae.AAC.3
MAQTTISALLSLQALRRSNALTGSRLAWPGLRRCARPLECLNSWRPASPSPQIGLNFFSKNLCDQLREDTV